VPTTAAFAGVFSFSATLGAGGSAARDRPRSVARDSAARHTDRTRLRACSNAWFAMPLEFIPEIARKKDPERCGGQQAPLHDLRAR
jgi:hypothetical protein